MCRNHETISPLIVKSINKGVYIKHLEYLILPVFNRVHDTLGNSSCQQDNVPLHKVAGEMDVFRKCNIQVEDLPLNSPDINSIEPVCISHKFRLHRIYPDIDNI